MKKIYVMPALALTLCVAATAKISLGGKIELSPGLIRAAMLTSSGSFAASREPEQPAETARTAREEALPVSSEDGVEIEKMAKEVSAPQPEITNLAGVEVSEKTLLSLPDEQRGGSVLLLHTHGCEAYTPSKAYDYEPMEDFRTTDRDFNVVRVGDEIEKVLTGRGINVIHDETLCDEPSFNDSYSVSLGVAKKYLREHPDIKVILDIHRDSIEDENGKSVKTISGEKTAQLMFVVGTDASGAEHPLWRQNLAFAMRLQQQIMKSHPGLMRPINLRKTRFNQQLSVGSLIVEVGDDANTLDEALAAANIFGSELADYLTGI